MVKQAQYPDLFQQGRIALADAILDILAKEPLLKARHIAYRLNTRFGFTDILRKDVNSLLYGKLKSQVQQVDEYKWKLRAVKRVSRPKIQQPAVQPEIRIIYVPVEQPKLEVPKRTFWASVTRFFI
jgi:hypothetical protein